MGNIVNVDSINNIILIKAEDNEGYGIVDFKLNLSTNSVKVTERCDNYFTNNLGPKELDVLIQGLTNLRKQLKDA